MVENALASLVEDELKTYETVVRVRQELEISRVDQAISRVQNLFMTSDDIGIVFDQVLKELLELTNSPYGFLSEVLIDPTTNTPFLKIGAMTNLAWNGDSEALSTQINRDGIYFRRLDTLIGKAIVDESVVISNDVKNDSRNHQFPHGPPVLYKYIGIPIHSGNRLESFDRRVVAEGIEDLATYQRLKQLGCDIGQGYYLSHPLPQAKALQWVSQSTWSPRPSE